MNSLFNKKIFDNEQERKEWQEIMSYVGLVTEIGLTLVLLIIIFFAIGLYIDRRLNTKGIFLIIGIIAGVIIGFYNAYRCISKMGGSIDGK